MKLLLSFFFNLSTCFVIAQDHAVIEVHYNFSHQRDTTQRDKMYSENMVLRIGADKSLYFSNDKAEADSLRRVMIENAIKKGMAEGSSNISIDLRGTKQAQGHEIYREFTAHPGKATVITKFNGVHYFIEDETGKIDWEIKEEIKEIKGLLCQQAIGNFRGRTYEAWFCNDLSFPTGPWKLSGLPGLIVEASDSKKEVVFALHKIENITDRNLPVRQPVKGIHTSLKDFEKMRKGYLDGLMAGTAANVDPDVSVSMKRTGPPASEKEKTGLFNNPLEPLKN